jgi:hypothetical protein
MDGNMYGGLFCCEGTTGIAEAGYRAASSGFVSSMQALLYPHRAPPVKKNAPPAEREKAR